MCGENSEDFLEADDEEGEEERDEIDDENESLEQVSARGATEEPVVEKDVIEKANVG